MSGRGDNPSGAPLTDVKEAWLGRREGGGNNAFFAEAGGAVSSESRILRFDVGFRDDVSLPVVVGAEPEAFGPPMAFPRVSLTFSYQAEAFGVSTILLTAEEREER